ncbi:hypothetical protein [Pseudoalteromonas lipolytica]|uniref:hypothetical protein n=1 Tax=Pseudoalteromonas lipolytica TaxID=570156 RepID=UPI0030A97925
MLDAKSKNAYLVTTNFSINGDEEVITMIVNCDNSSFTENDVMFLEVLNTLCAAYHFSDSNSEVESYSKFVRFSNPGANMLLWPSNNLPQRLSSEMLKAFAGIVPLVSLNELVGLGLISKVMSYFYLLTVTTEQSYSHQLSTAQTMLSNATSTKTQTLYSKESLSSCGWLYGVDNTIRLTPVLKGQSHPIYITVSKGEFDTTQQDDEKIMQLAIDKLNVIS